MLEIYKLLVYFSANNNFGNKIFIYLISVLRKGIEESNKFSYFIKELFTKLLNLRNFVISTSLLVKIYCTEWSSFICNARYTQTEIIKKNLSHFSIYRGFFEFNRFLLASLSRLLQKISINCLKDPILPV